MKTHANDRVEAVLNGKKYQTEFDGVLPGVTLPVGVDTTDPDYNQQVVWIGDTAYYVVDHAASPELLFLSRELIALDSGDNQVRKISAPACSAGLGAPASFKPVTVVPGHVEYVVR